jgi:hypothetical protein
LDCVTEFNVSSVVVVTDSEGINNLIDILQTSSSTLTNNPLVQILASGNQNMVGQVISSLSQVFNKINNQTVENAVASENINYDLKFLKSNLFSRWYSCNNYCCITIRQYNSTNSKLLFFLHSISV